MAPEVGKSAGIFVVHRETAGKLIRFRAAFAAALNAAVATDRQDAAFFPPEHAPRLREIDDRFDSFDAKLMLRETHAVDKNGIFRGTVEARKSLHLLASAAGPVLQHFPGLLLERAL